MTAEAWGVWAGAAATFVAAVVALGIAVDARFAEKRARDAQVRGFLGAIRTDIGEIWSRYEKEVGPRLRALPAGHAFDFDWPIRQDYFTVYAQTAHLLGLVDDRDLRRLIVSTYVSAKGMVDSLAYNSEVVKELTDAQMVAQTPISPLTMTRAGSLGAFLADYAQRLKDADDDLKRQVEQLLAALDRAGA